LKLLRETKIRFIRFITSKLGAGISVISVAFVFTNIVNFLKNINSQFPDKQRFYRVLIISIIAFLFLITALIILKLTIERIRKVAGSKIRFKLTFLFIFVAFIPSIVLSISSSFLINEAMSRTVPGNVIKPLEKSLSYYRESLAGELLKTTSELLLKPLLRNNPALYTKLFDKLDYAMVFMHNKNNLQIIFENNQVNLDKDKKKFFQEYFESDEFEEPVIHKLSSSKWIIFIIKTVDKKTKTFLLTGNVLTKKQIQVAEGINAILEKYKSLKIISTALTRDFQIFILLISLPVILIAVIIGFYLASEITKPINSLVGGTKTIANGVYGYQIKDKASDELGELIHAFNIMSKDLQENKNRLFEAEKLAAWREVAKKLAHEVKNPLTPIKLASERLLRNYSTKSKEEFEKILESCSTTIATEVDRLKDLVNEFSEFARFPASNFNSENIVELIKSFMTIYREANKNTSFRLINGLTPDESVVKVDKNQMRQVIINLIENALDAQGNNINISLSCVFKSGKKYVRLDVKDNGVGVPDDIAENIFMPHFTSKKKGNGLGLSIVKNIIEEHKGIIYFESIENVGTTFTVELPLNWRIDV
jgi:nitrogen fixation/metabolism regulation signal transduction histidine kinase